MNKILFILSFSIVCLSSIVVQAQEPNLQVNIEEGSMAQGGAFTGNVIPVYDPRLEGFEERIALSNPQINLDQIPSLFFTPAEQSLIEEARAGLTTRAPTDFELRQAQDGTVPMGPREVALAGIVYLSAGDWTIWLNGQKVTPNRLPPEILDIRVLKNSIRLKWFDAYTNQIFPIKLKTHQRFNIDTRIFLPG